ncbi:MAG: hypothetical protein LUC47_10045 [Clostridiales bacterium]|nr:hypothetical protein [Clostridiales bacterium]
MEISVRKPSAWKISLSLRAKDVTYFLAFFLLFTCDFYNTTTFKGVMNISSLLNVVRVFSVILIFVKCAFLDRYNIKQLSVIALLVGFAAISIFSSSTATLLDFILLAVGCRGVDDKKIVKTYLILGTIYLLIAMFCSLSGIIVNYSTVRPSTGTVRYSFGIVYSTDFAAHVFFLILAYHYIRKHKMKLLDVIIHIFIIAFLDRYCNARLSELMILATLILFLLYDYKRKIFQSKRFAFATQWVTLVCGIFSVGITYLYSSSSHFWVLLDE